MAVDCIDKVSKERLKRVRILVLGKEKDIATDRAEEAIHNALKEYEYGEGWSDLFIAEKALLFLRTDGKTFEEKKPDVLIARKLLNLSKSAKERGIYFDVSFKKLKALWKIRNCQITGKPLTVNKSIDRLDNTKGYTDDNIVVCTEEINAKKGSLTIEEISQIYNLLKRKKLV